MIKGLYEQVQRMKASGNPFWSYQYKINKLIVNAFYPMTQLFNHKDGTVNNSDVVVSLTTYPARIKTVWVTIATILNQTYKPSHVVLYLAKEQFPNGLKDLPSNLAKLTKRGLEIIFVDEDLKPHKKYFYALKQFQDKLVITVDDDIFYPENMIQQLVEASNNHPDAVVCSRSHRISCDSNGEISAYNNWINNTTKEPDILTMPVGCNGVLYKAEFFDDELFDIEKICDCSLYTDDLWLKAMELRNKVKAFNCSEMPLVYFDNILNRNTGLWHVNTSNSFNRNDEVWHALMNMYPDILKTLKE